MIFEKVLSTINKYNLIEDGDKIVLGISGGPDSICLLHILNKLKETFDIEIYAAHLNHQLRGIEAQKDALYVSQMCEKMGITYFIKSIEVSKYCEEEGVSIEEGARKLRYEMFDEIRVKTNSNKVAVGHNLNDQAETVLMRIMRGTGLQGLRGIEYFRDNKIIRPLLDVERKEIEDYCEEHNLNPRIDKSNLETIYTRNKVRLELIPYMKDNFNSNIIESIVRMSSSLRTDSDYIEAAANEEFEKICKLNTKSVEIKIQDYNKLHRAMKTRVIRSGISHILGDINFLSQKHIEDVIELENISKIGKKITLPRGVFAYRKQNIILLTTEDIVNEDIEFCYNIPSEGHVKIRELGLIVETQSMSINKYKSSKIDKESRGFDSSKIKGGLILRNRSQGDKIKLAGGTKKLKDLFINLKVPRENRCKVPVVLDEQGVLLVGEYKVSENYKIDSQTKEVLKISFKKL